MYRVRRYIKYLFTSGFRHGHGVHSPYLFGLITNVIENDGTFYSYEVFEKAERKVSASRELIRLSKSSFEPVSGKGVCKLKTFSKYFDLSPVYGRLMFRLINEFRPEKINVFGATTGLNLLYTSKADSRVPVRFTAEGGIPEKNILTFIKEWGLNNIEVLKEKNSMYYDNNISVFTLVNYPFSPEMSSVVANEFLATAKSGSVILIRGIHNSGEMGELWDNIKLNKKIRISLELFNMGIGITKEGLQKEDFVLRYKLFW
jgi:hypothetical protein